MAPTTVKRRVLGRYELLECIGAGGMAVVHRASLDGETVVIKRLRAELAQDPSFVRMMVREARLGLRIDHPAIVKLRELGSADGEPFLVMELVDGPDLARVLEHCVKHGIEVPIAVIVHIALQLASALAYAHGLRDEAGVPLDLVHRDLSPSNVLLTSRGAVKLADFGIAKAAQSVQGDVTRTAIGTMKGKLAYFAPEQAEGLAVDRRVDLFALGIVVMECLLRRRLFRGNDELETLRKVREAYVPRPSSIRPDVDGDLEAVLLKLLARDRAERPASADEVVAALRPIARRLDADAPQLARFLAEPGMSRLRESAPGIEPETAVGIVHVGLTPERRTPTRLSLVGRRWEHFIASLPEGLDSFPACRVKASVVRSAVKDMDPSHLPAHVPRILRDLAFDPPPVSTFLPEAHARALYLALADGLQLTDDEVVRNAADGNRRLLSGPFYKVLWKFVSPHLLCRNADSRWASFRRGTRVEVIHLVKHESTLALHIPLLLNPDLLARVHLTSFEVAMTAAGGRDVRTELVERTPDKVVFTMSWR